MQNQIEKPQILNAKSWPTNIYIHKPPKSNSFKTANINIMHLLVSISGSSVSICGSVEKFFSDFLTKLWPPIPKFAMLNQSMSWLGAVRSRFVVVARSSFVVVRFWFVAQPSRLVAVGLDLANYGKNGWVALKLAAVQDLVPKSKWTNSSSTLVQRLVLVLLLYFLNWKVLRQNWSI